MAVMKPTVSKTRDPATTSKREGRILNPPRFPEMTGLSGPGKLKKNDMAVNDRGGAGHGPFTKG